MPPTTSAFATSASAFVVDDDECDRGVHGTNERITRRAYLQGIRFLIALLHTL